MASRFDSKILLQARWIVAIIVALMFVFVFVRFGYWQLSRLDERRVLNATVEERSDGPPRPLAEILGEHGDDVAAMLHFRASVEGFYRADEEISAIGRTIGQERGTLVATPLDLADGTVLIVVRGLLPTATAGWPDQEGFEPPSGLVTLAGRIDDGEEPSRIGEPAPEDGRLVSLSRLDLDYIDRWIEGDVLPITLILEHQSPTDPNGTPLRVPPAELTEGSHLGYAVQWFGFALIVAVGVAVLIYRSGLTTSTPGTGPDRASRL